MKFLFSSTLLAILFFTHLFSEESVGALPDLKVGMELSFPPFEMISPEGKASGISVEIAQALGKFLARKVIIDNIPYVGLIQELKTNKIDLIVSSLTVTEKRKQSINFSEPYLTTGLCLLISQKSDLKNIEDVDKKGRVIVVKAGTSGEIYAKQHFHLAKLIILDKESACVLEVAQGKADAFIYDQFSVYTNWQKNLKTTRVVLEPFQKEYWAVGVKKGNDALLRQVNDFIITFREEGGFEAIGNKYLSKQKMAFKELNVPFVF